MANWIIQKITVDIINYLNQLIMNFQYQQVQIKESKLFSKKVCYIIVQVISSIDELIEKINNYFGEVILIARVEKMKNKFVNINSKYSEKKEKLIEIEKITDKTQEYDLLKYKAENSIKHINQEIAYFYVKLMSYCKDDSKETLEELLVEYNNFLSNHHDLNSVIDIIMFDIITKIEIGYHDICINNLYNKILIYSKILIKNEDPKQSKNLLSVIFDRIVNDAKNEKNNKDESNSDIENYLDLSANFLEKMILNQDDLFLDQSFKYDQVEDVVNKIKEKLLSKEAESKEEKNRYNKCNSELKNIRKMLDVNLARLNLIEKYENSDKKSNQIDLKKIQDSNKENENQNSSQTKNPSSNSNTSKSGKNQESKDDDDEKCSEINLDDYDLIEHLGRGGNADVIKAIDRKTGKYVALKIYHKDTIKEKQIINMIRISNSGVIGLTKTIGYRFNLSDKKFKDVKNKEVHFKSFIINLKGCILVMNLFKTSQLNTHIKEYLISNGKNHSLINPTIRSKIIFGVAAIMKKLHQKRIIHSDLKINNILLDKNNDPVICDFEYSYFVNEGRLLHDFNDSAVNYGTVMYMSPERFTRDAYEIDGFKADVYSYAILLYFMFSTSFEFSEKKFSRNIYHFIRMIVAKRRPIKPASIPDHYWKLIEECWADDPNDRPSFEIITNYLKDDKFALEEFGMKTDINELHAYRKKIDE